MKIGNLLSTIPPDLPSKQGGELPNFTAPITTGLSLAAGLNVPIPGSLEVIGNANVKGPTTMPPVEKLGETFFQKLTPQSYAKELNQGLVNWKMFQK